MRKFTKYPSNITASVDLPFSKKARQYAQAAWNKGMSVNMACDFVFNMMTRDGYYTDYEDTSTIQEAVNQVYEEEGDPNDPSTWVGACDVTATSQSPVDLKDKIYDLYQIATTRCDDSKIDQILINNGTSPDSRFIVDENTNVKQAYIDLIDYIKNNIKPDILNEREYALVYGDEVEACDKVTASEICYRDRDNDDRVVALDAGMTDEDVEEMLAAHPSYYRSTLDRFDDIDACNDVMASTEPKYFANMVSASIDEDGFEQLVDVDENDSTWKEPTYYQAYSYYGSDYRGLEDNIATPDTSVLMDWVWEHAARGGYIEVCGPKGCIKLDPDDLEEQVSNGGIDEYAIITQIDY